MKTIDYQLLGADSRQGLNQEVKCFLEKDYELYGEPIVSTKQNSYNLFYQAVIKKEN